MLKFHFFNSESYRQNWAFSLVNLESASQNWPSMNYDFKIYFFGGMGSKSQPDFSENIFRKIEKKLWDTGRKKNSEHFLKTKIRIELDGEVMPSRSEHQVFLVRCWSTKPDDQTGEASLHHWVLEIGPHFWFLDLNYKKFFFLDITI